MPLWLNSGFEDKEDQKAQNVELSAEKYLKNANNQELITNHNPESLTDQLLSLRNKKNYKFWQNVTPNYTNRKARI